MRLAEESVASELLSRLEQGKIQGKAHIVRSLSDKNGRILL